MQPFLRHKSLAADLQGGWLQFSESLKKTENHGGGGGGAVHDTHVHICVYAHTCVWAGLRLSNKIE